MILRLLAQDGALIAVASWLLRRRGISLRQVGLGSLRREQVIMGLVWGVALFAAAYLLGGILDWALRILLSRTGHPTPHATQWASDAFKAIHAFWPKMMFALIGAVVAPVSEELFFRGLIYNLIKSRQGVRAGIVYSALIFALAHAGALTVTSIVTIIVIFCMGLALAAVYERTGSLWIAILMHGVNNALMFVLLWRE